MKIRKISVLITAVLFSAMIVIPAFRMAATARLSAPIERRGPLASVPQDMPVAEGTITDDSSLSISKKLNCDNGWYVSFCIENLGSEPVVITINGENENVLEPGEKGRTGTEVTQGLFGIDKTYTFAATPGKNGGTVQINYKVYQQNN